MNDTDLAYAAGVIDGDGCICVGRQKRKAGRAYYVVQVRVSMKTDDVPLWFLATFNGHLYYAKPTKSSTRFCALYRWEVYGRSAAAFLRLVTPYLKLKKYRAELALQLADADHNREGIKRDSIGRILPLPEEEVIRRQKLAAMIREENKRTNARVVLRSQEIN